MYLTEDKVLTDFRHQSVRSDVHTGCGPGAASFLAGWRLGIRQYLLSGSQVKAITQSGYKTRLIAQEISAGRAFTNGSGAATAHPASSCTYRQSGVHHLSAVPTEMWGLLSLARDGPRSLSHGLYARQITQLPILDKLHPIQLPLIFRVPANVSLLGKSLTANSKACVGELRGSVLQKTLKMDCPSQNVPFLSSRAMCRMSSLKI